MHRAALVCLLFGCLVSCKKEPPAGLPPSSDWQAQPGAGSSAPAPAPGSAAMPPAQLPPNHPDMSGNPHPGGPPPAGAMPEPTPGRTLEKQGDRVVMGPFSFVAPKEWTEKAVTSSMRAAQFELSAKPGEEADLVVYYFGEGGAGGVDANLERWLGQFTQPDGKASKDVAKIEKTKVAGQDATVVNVTGRFTTTQMPGGPPPVDMTDGALIGAIVGSPSGPYYFKLTGRKKTVDANAARFKAMLASMKLK